MILAALLWLFQTIIFMLYGRGFIHFAKRLVFHGNDATPSVVLVFLTGLGVVTSLASLLSLGLNLSALALGILTVGAVVLGVLEWRAGNMRGLVINLKRFLNIQRIWLLAGLLLIGIVLEVSTRLPTNPDTAIYHAQTIHWIEDFPAVPGLGNLHTRLAFNSSWLVTNALFSLAFTGLQSFHTTPGLLLAVFCLYALGGVRKIYEKSAHLSDWVKALLLPLTFATIAGESSSPGTDFPAILVLWFVMVEWMSLREKTPSSPIHGLLIAWLSIFAITLKLSVAPAALFALLVWIGFLRARQFRPAVWLVAVGILTLIPWFARNAIVSGYLVYPMPAVDVFQFDWKIPRQTAVDEVSVIQSWARIPREDSALVRSLPVNKWASIWYLNQSLFVQILLWTILGTTTLFLLAALFSSRFRNQAFPLGKEYASTAAAILAGLVFWFFSAPDIRFGYGFVLAAFALSTALWLHLCLPIVKPLVRWTALLALLITILLWGASYRPLGIKSVLSHLVEPFDYAGYSTNPCQIHEKTLLCAAAYNECGYSAFPCILTSNPAVEMRGDDFSAGFRTIK